MSNLMEPLDSGQTALLEIVWPLIAEHNQSPVFNYVEHQMRERGLDIREVLSSFPTLSVPLYRGPYKAINYVSGGGLPSLDSRMYLTIAGLYHVKDDLAAEVRESFLVFLRAMSAARDQIADHPFDVPNIRVSLDDALREAGIDLKIVPLLAEIIEHEWLGVSISRQSGTNSVTGELSSLTRADFDSIDEYLNALAALAISEQTVAVPAYPDARALVRTITNFDVACELVLKRVLIRKPALDRSALLTEDAQTPSDLQAGVSVLGELFAELNVPGNTPRHALGRLATYLEQELPTIDRVRIEEAVGLMDAVREIRNSSVHKRPSTSLIAAHERLGLPVPIRDAESAWDTIRAQMERAFSMLQEEILAARPTSS